jgi:formylglycine-generating enzyme required for sulfatase activity
MATQLPTIFIGYSHKDKPYLDELLAVVEPSLRGACVLQVWSDQEIPSGQSWASEIGRAVETAKAAVLLLSSDFFGSRLTREQELPILLRRWQSADLELFTIFVAAVPKAGLLVPLPPAGQGMAEELFDFLSVQAENAPERPLERMDPAERNRLFDAVAERLRAFAQSQGSGAATRRLHVPHIDWVEIPGGPFIYQQGETRELPTFWIARYPVTNVQYQTFIDDDGYGEPRWWEGLVRPEPEPSRWAQANRPRTNVDWYEAFAFARWLNARLGLPDSSIRLPTELEWEKAARGEGGLSYPWGAEYRSGCANVDEKSPGEGKWYLEQTIAVGLYPHGRSPYDVHDLSGNVWEWCINKYDDLEAVAPDDSGDGRALRGGSWSDSLVLARADGRGRIHPDGRVSSGGFRVLSSVPIDAVR